MDRMTLRDIGVCVMVGGIALFMYGAVTLLALY